MGFTSVRPGAELLQQATIVALPSAVAIHESVEQALGAVSSQSGA
jgi:hypothetical protein